MSKLLNYTRLPLEDAVYANRLAYSVHFALQNEDGKWTALNHNSGVLFVRATENKDGSLNPKSLKNPWLFSVKEGGYGVFAVRTLANGETDTEDLGTAVFWTSEDLVRFEERGLVKLADGPLRDVRCELEGGERYSYRLQWQLSDGTWREAFFSSLEDLKLNEFASKPSCSQIEEIAVISGFKCGIKGDHGKSEEASGQDAARGFDEILGCVPRNVIEIPEELANYLKKKLMPAVNVGVELPDEIHVEYRNVVGITGEAKRTGAKGNLDGENAEATMTIGNILAEVRATSLYSDGARVPKKIVWDEETIRKVDLSRTGRYVLTGKVYQPSFAFPICMDRADPCVCRWNGKYYYIATNDADGNHTLYMRCADSLEGIRDAEEHLILDSTTYEGIGGLLWAPEFHEIDGRLYLFHACTPGPFFCEESHVMELREGGDPLCKEDWSRPRRVVRADGSDICEAGKEITLDMTEFEWQGELYAIWSQRQFLPKDLGAWLYIAKLNRKEPWKLASDTFVLSKPEYGWANNHTFVDEGPFALIRGDKLYVTFSSAAVDSTYVVGLLQIDAGKDPLDVMNWRKNNYPLFTSRSYEGEYGTGHNAYVIDEEGITWNTYHARPGVDGPRSTGIRRVHFDVDGEPMLDVTEELDLKEEFSRVETVLVVE